MRSAPLGLLALLLGCKAEPPEYGVGPEVWSPPTVHVGHDWLFSSARINRIEVELGPDAMEILRAQRRFSYPRDKVRGEAWIDGEAVGEIGVRVRGGLGSFQPIDEKPKLELDLNAFSGERFYGLESLSLNNLSEDCTGLQEAVAFAAYAQAGVPSSRTGFAQLSLNGQDYGLMLVVETQDDRWLRRHFGDRDGNLYDGKYHFSGFWPTVLDFGMGRDDWFDLEEGEDVGFVDITAVSEAALRAEARGRFDEALWSLVDWGEVIDLLRVEQWTLNTDGYASFRNNYRVYFEPGRPMVMIPWDTGAAFEADVEGAEPEDWEQPAGLLAQVCLADAECRARWDAAGPEVDTLLSDGALLERFDALAALTEEGFLGDPRGGCEAEEVARARARLRGFLDGRR